MSAMARDTVLIVWQSVGARVFKRLRQFVNSSFELSKPNLD